MTYNVSQRFLKCSYLYIYKSQVNNNYFAGNNSLMHIQVCMHVRMHLNISPGDLEIV